MFLLTVRQILLCFSFDSVLCYFLTCSVLNFNAMSKTFANIMFFVLVFFHNFDGKSVMSICSVMLLWCQYMCMFVYNMFGNVIMVSVVYVHVCV